MSQRITALTCVLFLLASSITASAAGKNTKTVKPPALSEHDRALHALDRLTFGPRPGDMEKVLATGVDKWIEQQLNPADIPNPGLDGRLTGYRTLLMSPRDLFQTFPPPQYIRDALDKKRPMPSDPIQFGLWEILVDKENEQRAKNAAAGQPMPPPDEAAQKAPPRPAGTLPVIWPTCCSRCPKPIACRRS